MSTCGVWETCGAAPVSSHSDAIVLTCFCFLRPIAVSHHLPQRRAVLVTPLSQWHIYQNKADMKKTSISYLGCCWLGKLAFSKLEKDKTYPTSKFLIVYSYIVYTGMMHSKHDNHSALKDRISTATSLCLCHAIHSQTHITWRTVRLIAIDSHWC